MKLINNEGSISIILLSSFPLLCLLTCFILAAYKTKTIMLQEQSQCFYLSINTLAKFTNLVSYAITEHNPTSKKLAKEKSRLKRILAITPEPSARQLLRAAIRGIEIKQQMLALKFRSLLLTAKSYLAQQKLKWLGHKKYKNQWVLPDHAPRIFKVTALDNVSNLYTPVSSWQQKTRLHLVSSMKPHYLKLVAQLAKSLFSLNLDQSMQITCGAKPYKKGKRWIAVIQKEI